MSSTITERQRINTSSAVKVPCKAATTANITLSGEQTIDGVACVTNDRVLVKNQTTASENGIYIVNTSSWSRARDWDGAYDVKKGTFVYVTGGTNSGFWYVTTADPIIPGTTSVAIAQASSQLITFSAFAQLLLDDADATAMFNTLGISAYIQTLLNDVDAATARATLAAAGLTDNNALSGNNTLSGDNDIKDTLEIYDPADTTKKVRIDAGSVSTATTRVVTVPDRDITLADPLTSGTMVSTATSATSYDFTSIPSWVKRITLQFRGVSTNGLTDFLVQIGDSGGIETSGYLGSSSRMLATVATTAFTTGFGVAKNSASAADVYQGEIVISLMDATNNYWTCHGILTDSTNNASVVTSGFKALLGGASLDRIRLTTVNGTDTFDAGNINILYE